MFEFIGICFLIMFLIILCCLVEPVQNYFYKNQKDILIDADDYNYGVDLKKFRPF